MTKIMLDGFLPWGGEAYCWLRRPASQNPLETGNTSAGQARNGIGAPACNTCGQCPLSDRESNSIGRLVPVTVATVIKATPGQLNHMANPKNSPRNTR